MATLGIREGSTGDRAYRMRAFVPVLLGALLLVVGNSTAGETTAGEVLTLSGVKAGLCVNLGVTDGEFTAELSANGKLLVHGLAADAADLARARKTIQAKGIYGQVSVERGVLRELPYADNLVNLVVANDVAALKGLSLEEVARVLTPNGSFCFKGTIDAGKLNAAGLGPATRTEASTTSTTGALLECFRR